jgi:F-type H+-transporting ATPase subunit a
LEETRKWRYGTKRWLVLLFVVLGIIAANLYPPIRPHIQVAPERLSHNPLFTLPVIGEFYLTNTLVAMLIVDLILIVIALMVRNAIRSGTLVPKGIAGAMEALLETLYNLTESTAGKHTRKIFPLFATIVLFVLIANWMELIPGVDSIGVLEHYDHGYPIQLLAPGIAALVQGEAHGENFMVIPYVRVLSTDLNFTLALALISVVMTQVIGFRTQGFRFLNRYFNTTTLFSKPGFGAIDLGVSILEFISELSKLLSFSFRLFGNIFAGAVLLFLVGSLIPVFAQSMVLLFEFFIGIIQAFVFGMLTLVFMTQATVGHGDGEHE